MNVSFYTTNAYQNYPQLRQDVNDIKGQVARVDSIDGQVGSTFAPCVKDACFGSITPVRRLMSLPDKISQGDIVGAATLSGLALINLPEDLRDVGAAARQINPLQLLPAKYNPFKPYEASYNYKEVQHPFSFFRGTFLHRFVDPNTTPHKTLAAKLFDMDTTMADTGFGNRLINFLGAKETDSINTKIKNIGHTEAKPCLVRAKVYEGSSFGKLTARAMNRTTKIGAAILAAIEIPKLFKAMGQGDNITEQIGNTTKQTAKSAINVTSILAGIGYGGAIGAQKFGAIGSLVGMGTGAVLGALTSKKVQEIN